MLGSNRGNPIRNLRKQFAVFAANRSAMSKFDAAHFCNLIEIKCT